MLAAVYNHVFIIEYLLQLGAKMEARDMQGTTALIYAATDGHVEAVEVWHHLILNRICFLNSK